MHPAVYHKITEIKRQNKKSFAVLVDPDKTNLAKADELINLCTVSKVDFIFVGGSLVVSDHLEDLVKHIKKECVDAGLDGSVNHLISYIWCNLMYSTI
jgi:putative glycerol-1-phosphate prenyltransferase